jgi:hypothetical protein
MSQRVTEPLKTFPVSGALAKYLRVKLSAGDLALAGSTDVELGVMENPTFAGDTVGTVHLRTAEGTDKFVASDAITAGNAFYAAANGKVASSGTVLIGIALETTTAGGDVFEGLRRQETSDSAASGGTTAAAFLVDSDSAIPKIELASYVGGTGDYKVTLKPAATLTGNRVVTIPDAATQVMVGDTATQTLTNKTLTAPVVTDNTEVVTATNVIAATESGKTFFLNSATEFVSTLPAPAAGLRFRFIVTGAPSGASYTIVTNSSANIIKGLGLSSDLNAASDVDFETSGCDTISFVDGKSVAGDCVDLDCDGTNWFARAFCTAFDAITFTTAS